MKEFQVMEIYDIEEGYSFGEEEINATIGNYTFFYNITEIWIHDIYLWQVSLMFFSEASL